MRILISTVLVLELFISSWALSSAAAFDLTPIPDVQVLRHLQYGEAFLDSVANNPLAVFLTIDARAQDAFKLGRDDFSFMEMKPILELIIQKLEKSRKDAEAEARELDLKNSEELLNRARAILNSNIPYKELMRFTFAYARELDRLARIKNPSLPTAPFKAKVENDLERILKEVPAVIIFPSFAPLDLEFFNRTRAVPFRVIGLSEVGIYADGYNTLSPGEFAFHDLDHAIYMLGLDKPHFGRANERLEETVKVWDDTSNFVLRHFSVIRDQDLKEAVGLLLFEIFHEKSNNWDLRELKTRLETHVDIEKVNQKLESSFFSQSPILTQSQRDRLMDAEGWVSEVVGKKIEANALKDLDPLLGKKEPVYIDYVPKLTKRNDKIQSIEINENSKISILIGKHAVTQYQFLLKNEDLTHVLNPDLIDDIEKLRWQKQMQMPISLELDSKEITGKITGIRITKEGRIRVQLQTEAGSTVEGIIPKNVAITITTKKRPPLDAQNRAKLAYFLDSFKNGIPIDYSLPEKPERLRGIVDSISNDENGHELLSLKDGSTIRKIPLSDIFVNLSPPVAIEPCKDTSDKVFSASDFESQFPEKIGHLLENLSKEAKEEVVKRCSRNKSYVASMRRLDQAVVQAAIKSPEVQNEMNYFSNEILNLITETEKVRLVNQYSGKAPTEQAIENSVNGALADIYGSCKVSESGCVGKNALAIREAFQYGNFREIGYLARITADDYLPTRVFCQEPDCVCHIYATKKTEVAKMVYSHLDAVFDLCNRENPLEKGRFRKANYFFKEPISSKTGRATERPLTTHLIQSRLRKKEALTRFKESSLAVPLSPREKSFLMENHGIHSDGSVYYSTGESYFAPIHPKELNLSDPKFPDPSNLYYLTAKKYGFEILTTISGTAENFLNVGCALGMTTKDQQERLRLGIIGYIVPQRHHSVYEVLTASKAFRNLNLNPNNEYYKYIYRNDATFEKQVEEEYYHLSSGSKGKTLPTDLYATCVEKRKNAP